MSIWCNLWNVHHITLFTVACINMYGHWNLGDFNQLLYSTFCNLHWFFALAWAGPALFVNILLCIHTLYWQCSMLIQVNGSCLLKCHKHTNWHGFDHPPDAWAVEHYIKLWLKFTAATVNCCYSRALVLPRPYIGLPGSKWTNPAMWFRFPCSSVSLSQIQVMSNTKLIKDSFPR